MNSSADIKGFVGRNGGVVCTSSNAKRALQWSFERGQRVFFFPRPAPGPHTAVLGMGLDADDCVLYDPHKPAVPTRGSCASEDDPVALALLRARRCTKSSVDEVRCGCRASTSWSTPSAGTTW